MTYTQEELAKSQLRHVAMNDLRQALRRVLNSPEYEGLSNYCKAEILLDLENGGEYNPLG
jgi:hypothetical protein